MGAAFISFLWTVSLLGTIISVPVDKSIEIQEPNDPRASPLEEAGLFEGDMVLTEKQEEVISSGRSALVDGKLLWPRNTVYYIIEPDFNQQQLLAIKQALEYIEHVSCVKFVSRTNQVDYVRVTGEYTGCWSALGHRGGVQQLNLQPNGCMSRGTIIHEFLHTLGFVHMHSSTERDFYVSIDRSSIQPGKESNFNIYSAKVINNYGIPYDYDSVMHYGATAFSKNGKNTITPYEPGVTIGQRVGMSYKDIKRLNMHYPECN